MLKKIKSEDPFDSPLRRKPSALNDHDHRLVEEKFDYFSRPVN
jgi:hypothetical protein